ncbi:MAG: SDR family oxidoreductase [Bacteroidetes bacterium]|nr:SDR family oxidoreductase [Bacteroidota bacterium]
MKYALITGSSSGIGKAIALRLSKKGYFIFITYKDNVEGANRTLESVKEASDGKVIQLDLGSSTSIEQCIIEVRGVTSTLFVFVNNAGVYADLVNYFSASFDNIAQVVNTNITGTFSLTQKLIPLLKEAKSSFIINIGSIKGEVAGSSTIVYGATKSALINFTKTLSKVLPSNIKVEILNLGYVKTERYDQFSEKTLKSMLAKIPTHRFTTPEEVAEEVMKKLFSFFERVPS